MLLSNQHSNYLKSSACILQYLFMYQWTVSNSRNRANHYYYFLGSERGDNQADVCMLVDSEQGLVIMLKDESKVMETYEEL